jgi:hypothetical protein
MQAKTRHHRLNEAISRYTPLSEKPKDADGAKCMTNKAVVVKHLVRCAGSTSQDADNMMCRFCFSNDDPNDTLLSPCECIGSQKFVHTSCLVKWQTFVIRSHSGVHSKDQRHAICNVCRSKFNHLPPSRADLFPELAGGAGQRELWTLGAAEALEFDALGLNATLLRGIYASGMERPSVAQQRSLKPMLLGHDVLVQSSGGSGNTTASCIVVLNKIDPVIRECQAIILAPARESAQQLVRTVATLSDFMDVQIHACVGGTSVRDDIRALEAGGTQVTRLRVQ